MTGRGSVSQPDHDNDEWGFLMGISDLLGRHIRHKPAGDPYQGRKPIDMTPTQIIRAQNRHNGTSPELDEAVRRLTLYIGRLRDPQNTKPLVSRYQGGVDI